MKFSTTRKPLPPTTLSQFSSFTHCLLSPDLPSLTLHCASPLMALVPLGEPPALQHLLQNVFIADRQVTLLDRMLGDLIDMTDDFEDLAAPAVLRHLRGTIQSLERAIYFAKIAKLHQIIRLHRAIRTTWHRWHVAPPVELDFN